MSDYQGWANYETWAVNLWMDNEEGSQRFWQGETELAWEDAAADGVPTSFTQSDHARHRLSDAMKNVHEENSPEVDTSVYSDLLTSALSEVNWDEIADTWLENHVDDYEPIKAPARKG